MYVYRQHDTIIHTAALYLSDDLVIHVLEKGKEEGHAGPWLGGTNTTSSHIETELNWPLLCLTPMLYQKSSLFSKDVQGRTVVHFAPLGERSLAFLKWFKDVISHIAVHELHKLACNSDCFDTEGISYPVGGIIVYQTRTLSEWSAFASGSGRMFCLQCKLGTIRHSCLSLSKVVSWGVTLMRIWVSLPVKKAALSASYIPAYLWCMVWQDAIDFRYRLI